MKYIIVVIILFVGVVESIRHRKLTVAGAVAGGITGFLVFVGAGWTGLLLLATFFLLGTVATSWKRQWKTASGMAQEKGGQRNAGQVLANGGVAGLVGLLTLIFTIPADVSAALMAGAFSAATADTLSSELGTVYGQRFYNILTFKKDRKGLDGVVSLEGTLLGIVGSALVAAIYCVGFGWDDRFVWIILAGTLGNILDSILGAAFERRKMVSNDAVNLANTLTGALVVLLFL